MVGFIKEHSISLGVMSVLLGVVYSINAIIFFFNNQYDGMLSSAFIAIGFYLIAIGVVSEDKNDDDLLKIPEKKTVK